MTNYLQSGINNLFLDEPFLTKILTEAGEILDHVRYVRESQGNDTFINYIFEGNVIVTHNETKAYINTIPTGDFFELNQEIQKRQRFVVDQG